MTGSPLVEARGLARVFASRRWIFGQTRTVRAVDGVDLTIRRGECLGVVGESGSGKSTLGALLLGLQTPTTGTVQVDGTDLASLKLSAMRRLRADMALVHQNPLGALDPRMTVGAQIVEPLQIHTDRAQALAETWRDRGPLQTALQGVGLPPEIADRFPHQISGGQRQRCVLARALILRPRFVVFDEAVSALDVSVQAQILLLIRRLQADTGVTSLFITHDLRAVRQVAGRVAVMWKGRVVEEGKVAEIIADPQHHYTQTLVAAVPSLTPARATGPSVPEIAA